MNIIIIIIDIVEFLKVSVLSIERFYVRRIILSKKLWELTLLLLSLLFIM